VSVSRLKTVLTTTLFSITLCFTQISFAVKKDVHIGVLAMWGEKVTKQMWQPTMNYLNQSIPNYNFILNSLKLHQIDEVIKQNNLDFILTNSGNYIELSTRYGISRLATLKTRVNNKTTSQFSAVIFTKSNRDDIQSLDDLHDKSFMAVKKNVIAGFQMAWLEFKNHGINPFDDFKSLQFSGHPQDKIVYAVLNGVVDAGTVRSSILEHMAANGLIDIGNIKILNRKTSDNFPFLHSTVLYPEWPIAKLQNTPAELAKAVSISLLQMPTNSIAAKQSHSAGWTVPLDYSPVRHLYKALNLPPFKVITQPNFFKRYWGPLLLFLMLFLQPLFLYIRKLRIDIQVDSEKLAQSEAEWSNALDFLDEPMYMVDLKDRIIRANKAFYKKINTSAEEAVGKVVTDYTHPEGEESPCEVCQSRKDLVDSVLILEADDPVNQSDVPMEISVKVIRDEKNKAIGIIQRMRDLTKAREAEKALRRSESLFKELLNATPEPLVVANSDGTIVLVNTQFEKEFGYNRKEIIGHKIEKLIPAKHRSKHVNIRTDYSFHPTKRPMGRDLKIEGLHKDGHIIPIDISLSPFNIDGEMLIISTIHNITDRLNKEKELKRLASFPELNPNPIIEFKKNGIITYANSASIKLFPSIMDMNFEHEIFYDINNEFAEIEKNHELVRNIEVNDSTFEQKIVYDPETKVFRMYIWDITKLRNLTRKMTYQATHDALTNLINRREFESRLKKAIEDSQHNNKTHSLCYMDLDQFKAVNDSCGHAAGDELLKQLAIELKSIIRETDTFARLGGDEFGLLLESCPIEKATMLAEEVRKKVESFRFHWDNKTFKVGISIGIVTITKTSGSTKEIQSAADTACYMAKEQGRNRIHVYEIDSNAIAKHTSETNWLNRINTALDDNDFVLYFQKIASLNNSEHEHYEVLIRMIDKEGNTIPPGSFIPAAERFNIMSSVDSWVIKNTLSIMQQEKYKNINFSINLSGQSLGDLIFMENCISQLEKSEVNPERVCFEITETAMIANLSSAIRSISILQGLGCKIALDDFGSGLSSFAYLKNLPVDYLKIDGSLIKDLETDSVNVTMVKSIIHIGHSMKLETIAEYVENNAILDILRDLKIDYVQGYGIAKPVPLEEIKLLETI